MFKEIISATCTNKTRKKSCKLKSSSSSEKDRRLNALLNSVELEKNCALIPCRNNEEAMEIDLATKIILTSIHKKNREKKSDLIT